MITLSPQQLRSMEEYYSQWKTTPRDVAFVVKVYDILVKHKESASIANITAHISETDNDGQLVRFTTEYVNACLHEGMKGRRC